MFAANCVLESVDGIAPFDEPARILWIDRSQDLVTLFSLTQPLRQPWHMRASEVESSIENGQLRTVAVRLPAYMLRPEGDLAERERGIRDRNWERIKAIADGDQSGQIHQPGALGAMIARHAPEIGMDRKSLYRLLYRYWCYGMTPNAFLPAYENSGGSGKSKQYAQGMPRGRPRRHKEEQSGAKLLSEADKQAIRAGYALYRDNKVKSIQDAYVKTLNRFYRVETLVPGAADDAVHLKPLQELPNIVQFSYWGKKAFDDISVLRGRSSERKWALKHRPLLGRADERIHGPCHRYEVDATIADIYLVSRFNRAWLIGRPVVYVVIDVFSRMIAGVFVGLEGPSWNGARHALFNAFSDKVAYCAAHGITITTEDWPCVHLPHELVADRGEMLGKAAEGIVTGLGINLAIMPPFRPDWKGIVESHFRILNQLTQIHWSPGAVRSRIKERGDRDYTLDAALNIEEFTSIVLASVLHYNQHSRDPARLSAAMIADAVDPTPINVWNWGMAQGMGQPNIQSRDAVYLHLLPRDRGTVRAGGIHFNGMIYTNPADPNGHSLARARLHGRAPVDVWYEPVTVEHVWIQGPDKSFICCPLRQSERRYHDRRLEEVQDMLAMTRTRSDDIEHRTLTSRVQLDDFIQSTLDTAMAEKHTADPARPKEKKAMRQHRSLERLSERVLAEQRAPHAEGRPMPPPPTPSPDSAPHDTTAQDYAGERSAEVIDILSRLHPGEKKP